MYEVVGEQDIETRSLRVSQGVYWPLCLPLSRPCCSEMCPINTRAGHPVGIPPPQPPSLPCFLANVRVPLCGGLRTRTLAVKVGRYCGGKWGMQYNGARHSLLTTSLFPSNPYPPSHIASLPSSKSMHHLCRSWGFMSHHPDQWFAWAPRQVFIPLWCIQHVIYPTNVLFSIYVYCLDVVWSPQMRRGKEKQLNHFEGNL